ncbi:MAG: hypothetical protein RJA70_820 [Pseudomonadota bacterium]
MAHPVSRAALAPPRLTSRSASAKGADGVHRRELYGEDLVVKEQQRDHETLRSAEPRRRTHLRPRAAVADKQPFPKLLKQPRGLLFAASSAQGAANSVWER